MEVILPKSSILIFTLGNLVLFLLKSNKSFVSYNFRILSINDVNSLDERLMSSIVASNPMVMGNPNP